MRLCFDGAASNIQAGLVPAEAEERLTGCSFAVNDILTCIAGAVNA